MRGEPPSDVGDTTDAIVLVTRFESEVVECDAVDEGDDECARDEAFDDDSDDDELDDSDDVDDEDDKDDEDDEVDEVDEVDEDDEDRGAGDDDRAVEVDDESIDVDTGADDDNNEEESNVDDENADEDEDGTNDDSAVDDADGDGEDDGTSEEDVSRLVKGTDVAVLVMEALALASWRRTSAGDQVQAWPWHSCSHAQAWTRPAARTSSRTQVPLAIASRMSPASHARSDHRRQAEAPHDELRPRRMNSARFTHTLARPSASRSCLETLANLSLFVTVAFA